MKETDDWNAKVRWFDTSGTWRCTYIMCKWEHAPSWADARDTRRLRVLSAPPEFAEMSTSIAVAARRRSTNPDLVAMLFPRDLRKSYSVLGVQVSYERYVTSGVSLGDMHANQQVPDGVEPDVFLLCRLRWDPDSTGPEAEEQVP